MAGYKHGREQTWKGTNMEGYELGLVGTWLAMNMEKNKFTLVYKAGAEAPEGQKAPIALSRR